MKLYAGDLYWNKTKPNPLIFEPLKNDIDANVLIIGGGMSGNLCAYVLSSSGMKVTVVDAGKIGNGSSSANTGLLQYCSDKRISTFIEEIGEERGVLFYKMCLEAMDRLTTIINELGEETDYRLRESILYASKRKDEKILKKDYQYLKKYDFPVEFIDNAALKERYNIDKPSALRTWHDAEVNPYKLIQELARKNNELGVQYYEDTEIDLEHLSDHHVVTVNGNTIRYEILLITTGYTKIYPVIKEKCVTKRTYAFCSTPMEPPLWKNEAMIWETHVPYLYFRTTVDHRIIAGGLDEKVDGVEENVQKTLKKAKKIAKEIQKVFPHLKITLPYTWNALFYGSKDGIPFIGRDPVSQNRYYLLGYEGNGTCYSVAGSFILKDLINGNPNPYTELVKVDR